MEAWLQRQPVEVAVAFAARAALRVLPLLQNAQSGSFRRDYFEEIVLPVFLATDVAWSTAKYPAKATEFKKTAGRARFAAYVVGNGAAQIGHTAARDVAFAAYYAATGVAPDAELATTYAANAISDAIMVAQGIPASSSYGSAYDALASADAALWSAVSIDAARVVEGAAVSVIVGSPLWPQGQTDWLRSLWQEMKAALLAAKQDWDVWTIWYDDRLAGHVRDEKRELAYVRIEEALWDQGPAIVNAEIKRLTEALEPPQHGVVQGQARISSVAHMSAGALLKVAEPTLPVPVENVPSAVSFGWSSRGTITVVAGAQNWPVLPFKGGQQDHANRLDACRVLATDTARSLRIGKWNARSDYVETLDQYVAFLPKQPEEGNFLLADAKARVIRHLFAAETDILPAPIAIELKVLLEHHIGLRAYYPATEEFYESVRSGHLETPLPTDAVEGFIQGVRNSTPALFEPNVAGTLENTAQPFPEIPPVNLEAPKSNIEQPVPPPDPLGEVDPEKSQRFTLASGINALWNVVSSGKKADETLEGWSKVIGTLGPYAAPILKWLRAYVLGG